MIYTVLQYKLGGACYNRLEYRDFDRSRLLSRLGLDEVVNKLPHLGDICDLGEIVYFLPHLGDIGDLGEVVYFLPR